MAIRRRITTTIDEIDDSLDRIPNTRIPEQTKEYLLSDTETATSIPSTESTAEEIHDSSSPDDIPKFGEVIGRTYPDLFVTFINDYRVISVLLIAISILIFITKIDINRLESLWYPFILSIIFHVIWFLLPRFVRYLKK
ncbi:hypothetical protein ACFLTB_04825 [Chloroflexota bacterium]